MPLLSKQELKTLIEQPAELCVSIYLPTYQAGPEIQQNPIRFKNLMREAEERLIESGCRRSDAVELLKPAQELDDAEFWRYQNEGLALFMAKDFFRYYRLPLNFEELVVVGDQFHLKPLMPLFTGDGRFFILALSQDEIRLLEGTRHHVQEVFVEKVPETVSENLGFDWAGKGVQYRISTSHGGTNNPYPQAGSPHGQGSPETDDKKQYILQFFHQVNEKVAEHLQGDKAPLILAGVEYLFPIYQEANSYPHLQEEGITGNPENLKNEELHTQAWPLISPYFEQEQKEAAERFAALFHSETPQASRSLKEIVQAAYYQRVDSLFVALDQHYWGRFDPENNTVEIHDQENTGDEDLLDFAAIYTFLNGGTVYAVEQDQIPDHAPVAATFRY